MTSKTFKYIEIRNANAYSVEYTFSGHALARCQQRGITKAMVHIAMKYGKVIYKQGLAFYYVTSSSLPLAIDQQTRSRVNNVVVIVNEEDCQIVTSYRCSKGMLHIRKKSKSLSVYAVA
jgi:hypothetical protein